MLDATFKITNNYSPIQLQDLLILNFTGFHKFDKKKITREDKKYIKEFRETCTTGENEFFVWDSIVIKFVGDTITFHEDEPTNSAGYELGFVYTWTEQIAELFPEIEFEYYCKANDSKGVFELEECARNANGHFQGKVDYKDLHDDENSKYDEYEGELVKGKMKIMWVDPGDK